MVPGILLKELRNPAIAFLVGITILGFFPITQQVNSTASLIVPIVVVLLGFINSIVAECRKKAYDEATNKALYNKYL
jgi:cytochrome bd-type quinol oxidase subunit 2